MPVHADQSQADGALDRGPRARERERMCVTTRVVRPVGDLIRFVVGPDGEAVPDLKCNLPGRGVWVTATHHALEQAIRQRALARGFKRDVRLPADLVARTEQLLQKAVLDALAMCAKAGLVAAGFAKASAALERDEAVALLHAAEASPEGVRKLAGMARNHGGKSIPVVEFLTSAQLDLALNRPNVVHAVLLSGSASDTFLSRSRRLERYRTGDVGDRGNKAGKSAAH